MTQMALFEISPIHCRTCNAELRDLPDLREPCGDTGGIHQVSTGDYFALYRKSYDVVLA